MKWMKPDTAGAPAKRGDEPSWRSRLVFLAVVVAVLWGLEIVDALVFGGRLDAHGIVPRTLGGLWGILFAPFLHHGFGHLIANSLPLVILGFLVLMRGARAFALASLIIGLGGGLGVWLTGPSYTVHIGASGLIFGYFGFLLLIGFFERRILPILVSLLVGFLYGGMIWGVLPGQQGVSWQGHLFGFGFGLVAARLLGRRRASAKDAA